MIEHMEAGRELDAVVARAMGLNVVALDWPCRWCDGGYMASFRQKPHSDDWTPGPVYAGTQDSWPPHDLYGDGTMVADVEPVLFYSTDYAAMGAALEWLAKHPSHDIFSLTYRGFGGERLWEVRIYRVGSTLVIYAPTPQLAVARAVAMIGEARKGER